MTQTTTVLITKDRSHLLHRCLESLSRQTVALDEIIVVDNASADDTSAVCKSFSKDLPLRYIYEGRIGRGAARAAGVEAARNSLILFLDDDCVADENWVEEHLRWHKLHPQAAAIGGRIVFDGATWWSDVQQTLADDYFDRGHLMTANISYKQEIFKSFGNFDGSLLTSEDHQFHQRLSIGGAILVYKPEISVSHISISTLGEAFQRYRDYAHYSFVTNHRGPRRLLHLAKRSCLTFANCWRLLILHPLRPSFYLGIPWLSLGLICGYFKGAWRGTHSLAERP